MASKKAVPAKAAPTKAAKPEAPAPAPAPAPILPTPPCPACAIQRELIKRVLAHFDGGVLDPTLVPALHEAVK